MPPRAIAGRPFEGRPGDEIRDCPTHGLSTFRVFARGIHARWRCVRCVADAVTRRHRRVRAVLVEEAGGRCALCGYDRCMWNLHFHHVDPATKSFAMTMARGKALEAYRAEARKCVLLCANCHGEVEYGLVESPPAGAKFAT